MGSITTLTDSLGNPAAGYVYDSFGNVTEAPGSIPNPYRYTAREFDSETGLYYYRARYYDPNVGRFLSEDLIRFNGGINFYAYVLKNPLILVDPSGRHCLCVFSISTGHFQCDGFREVDHEVITIDNYGYSGYPPYDYDLAATGIPGRDHPRQGGPIPLGNWTIGRAQNGRPVYMDRCNFNRKIVPVLRFFQHRALRTVKEIARK